MRRIWISVSIVLGTIFAWWVAIYFIMLLGQGAFIEAIVSFFPQKHQGGMNILVLGVDDTQILKRSDTILVIHLNEEKQRVSALSIPRDTRANISGIGVSKINHAYAHGGVSLLQDTVSSLLNIPIHRYVKADIAGVEQIIDQLGGLTINVQRNMRYNDNAGDLHIDLKAGKQTLDGKEAVGYLRFRNDSEGDIGRIRRQQAFVQALGRQILGSGKVIQSAQLLKQLRASIDTDISNGEMLKLLTQFGPSIQSGNLKTGSIPGQVSMIGGISYWRPDISGLDRMVNDILFGFPNQQIQALNTPAPSQIKTPDKSAEKDKRRKVSSKELNRAITQGSALDESSLEISKDNLKIEILNGNGIPGSATQVAAYLRKSGFDIFRTDNSQSFDYPKTLVVDWKGNLQTLLPMTQLLGINPNNIIVYDRPQKPIDVTIVIGKDWEELKLASQQ